jgi:hypothetical protein
MRTMQIQGAFGKEPMGNMMKNDKMKNNMMMMK